VPALTRKCLVMDQLSHQMTLRLGLYVGLPYKYREVLEYLRSSGLRVEDRVLRPLPFPSRLGSSCRCTS